VTTPPPESAQPTAAPVSPSTSCPNQLLEYAWQRHDIYSDNASNAQKRFFFVRRLLAYLSVAVVFLSVLQPTLLLQVGPAYPDINDVGDLSLLALFRQAFDQFRWSQPFTWIGSLALVDFLLILLPILATALLAFAVKFDRGNSWVLLRGNSETLKMEIFYYRTKVKQYKRNRNAILAEKIQLVSERVKGSAVHQAALSPYEGQPSTRLRKGVLILLVEQGIGLLRNGLHAVWDFLLQLREVEDDNKPLVNTSDRVLEDTPEAIENDLMLKRYVDLDADHYIRYRLADQFDWYRRKAKTYDRDYQFLQTSVYLFGGLGTLLAATGFQNWVAVSATLATALAGYLEYKRVEATLVGYNQAADALYDIRAWWSSLSEEEKAKPINFEKLVTSTEETIRSEHTSWLQDMQDRLANLYGDVGEEEPEDGSPPEGIGPSHPVIEADETTPPRLTP